MLVFSRLIKVLTPHLRFAFLNIAQIISLPRPRTDCCVIGLQSTGEAAANDAAKKSGVKDEAVMGDFVSAPQQALRKTILSVFPPAPKHRGVIAPDFIYPKMDVLDDVVMP